MLYHKIHSWNLCGLHELCECVFSNVLLEKMICHKIHNCNLCGLHELYECVSSIFLLEKMIYHKTHICNLCGLHELCGYVSSNFLLVKIIYHKIHICSVFVLHEKYWYAMILLFEMGMILCKYCNSILSRWRFINFFPLGAHHWCVFVSQSQISFWFYSSFYTECTNPILVFVLRYIFWWNGTTSNIGLVAQW